MLWVTSTMVTSGTQLADQRLDLGRCYRVERRARLVEQEHLGLDGQGPADAQALLLAAGELDRRSAQAVLDDVPQGGLPQRGLGRLEQQRPLANAVQPEPRGARCRRSTWSGTRSAAGTPFRSGCGRARVACRGRRHQVADPHGAGHHRAGVVVHAVHHPQDGRLSASRRPDECGHLIGRQLEPDPSDHDVLGEAHRHVLEHDCGGTG